MPRLKQKRDFRVIKHLNEDCNLTSFVGHSCVIACQCKQKCSFASRKVVETNLFLLLGEKKKESCKSDFIHSELTLTVNSLSRLLYIPFVGNSEICGFKSMYNCLELNTPPTFYLQINQYCVFEDIS